MKKITILLVSIALMVSACAASSLGQGIADASVMGANYTNDYINFTLMSPSGKNLGMGGDAKPFSDGGAGGTACCALLPGVGQTVRVEFRVGGFNDAADQYKTYIRDVVVKGVTSNDPDSMNYLIVRFFPDHNVEAEFITESLKSGAPVSPRVDELFYGRRVMRHLGE
ncbi:hypothetical protein DLM46_09890 [Paraburkholderia lacunae]|uniref:DUF3304 domain-containing protein n=2 Tax=Paraburkholderia lacunae TaxID=2211104 RepID=A0A370NCB5_9BURK|nr:hypothetical protein DLM46_09890 [Paraburkholderia lacunae]